MNRKKMGVFWLSHAEIVTTKPQKLKKLIEQIVQQESVAPVRNLEVNNKSIFFNSDGYGCYGVGWENPNSLLFREIFERFEEPLLCFEYVIPCQSQGYYFSSKWAKKEGEVDCDEYEKYYQYNFLLLEEGDISRPNEGLFDDADVWHIDIDRLKQIKNFLPHLYAAYMKAKKDRFHEWVKLSDGTPAISYEIAYQLAESYSDDTSSVLDDCHKLMVEWIKQPVSWFIDDCEMPKRFPKLQTAPQF